MNKINAVDNADNVGATQEQREHAPIFRMAFALQDYQIAEISEFIDVSASLRFDLECLIAEWRAHHDDSKKIHLSPKESWSRIETTRLQVKSARFAIQKLLANDGAGEYIDQNRDQLQQSAISMRNTENMLKFIQEMTKASIGRPGRRHDDKQKFASQVNKILSKYEMPLNDAEKSRARHKMQVKLLKLLVSYADFGVKNGSNISERTARKLIANLKDNP